MPDIHKPDIHKYYYEFDPESGSTAARVVRLVGRGKRVLELGMGPGSITRVLQEAQCRVVGVELDAAAAERAAPFCERTLVADLNGFPFGEHFAPGEFDVIVAADVLEHLSDPWACLRALRPLLKPDGYLVLSAPNVAHVTVVAALLLGSFPYRPKGLLDRTHLRFFGRSELEDMLLGAGFLPEAWETVHVAPEVAELSDKWHALPMASKEFLAQHHPDTAYQFVVRAFPSTEQGWVASARGELEQCRAAFDRAVAENRSLQAQVSALQLEQGRLAQESAAAKARYDSVVASRAWRLTAPLRHAVTLLRRVFGS